MKNILLLVIILLPLFTVKAQLNNKGFMTRGDKYFNESNYAQSIVEYEKSIKNKKVNPLVYYNLAVSYDRVQNIQNALNNYQLYIQKDSVAVKDAFLRIAQLEKTLGHYDIAKKAFTEYWQKFGTDSIAVFNAINSCTASIGENKKNVTIKNIAIVNTIKSDLAANKSGNNLYYVSNSNTEVNKFGDKKNKATQNDSINLFNSVYKIYTAQLNNSIANPIKGTGEFQFEKTDFAKNFIYDVGPLAFSKKGDTAYCTVTDPRVNKKTYFSKTKRERFSSHNSNLYMLVKDSAGNWQKPSLLFADQSLNFSFGHAALSTTGDVLYFASNMSGGMGGFDIWYCTKNADGVWESAVNCGSVINTSFDEVFPTVNNMDEINFSSDGHLGIGGLDIYKSEGNKNTWTTVANLNAPINSSYDDFNYLMHTDSTGFVSSNRIGGVGSDDIYAFTLLKKIYKLKISLLGRKDGAAISTATLNLKDAAKLTSNTGTTDNSGTSYFTIDKSSDYTLDIAASGYVSQNLLINRKNYGDLDTIAEKVYLTELVTENTDKVVPLTAPFKVGDKFELKNFFYNFDKFDIRADAALILDELAVFLNNNPQIKITLSAHTDSRGTDKYNLKLSDKRAKAAIDYLVSKGIERNRMKGKGYGESQLVNDCKDGVTCTVEEHAKNRRTEIMIISIDK